MSREVFLLPDVGEGLIEAEVVTWKVRVGDVVTLNQPLVDVETAKAVVELPSPFAGTVVTLHAQAGDVVDVNQPLVTFDVDAEPAPHATPKHVVHDVPDEGRREPVLIGYGVATEDEIHARTAWRTTSIGATGVSSAHDDRGAPGPVRTTPPVRLLAKQYGVDLRRVAGTGRDGLVTRDDVERARTARPVGSIADASRVATSPRMAGRELAAWDVGPREERIAVRGVLKAMAESMTLSVATQPQAAVWTRVDATRTTELIASLKAHPDWAGERLSPLTIVAMALCDAARRFPGLNSHFDAAAQEVVVRRYVNLGIAADTPRGLVVPNIKDADQLDLRQMARALGHLVATARAGTTPPADMAATTLTITNVGPFGVDGAMAILPPGTGAILCVGQVAPAPWVVDGAVVVRQVLELSMTFDHRQIDGAMASSVMAHLARYLGDPAPALLAR